MFAFYYLQFIDSFLRERTKRNMYGCKKKKKTQNIWSVCAIAEMI